MDKYKIRLLSNKMLRDYQEFLHVTSSTLEDSLNLVSERSISVVIPYTSDKWDREEDLDLFQATVWKNRLTKLGIECEIVKIDYSKENP
mgnify:CR=1 FL=1